MQEEPNGPSRDAPAPDFEARLNALARRVESLEGLKVERERRLLVFTICVAAGVLGWLAVQSVDLYARWKANQG